MKPRYTAARQRMVPVILIALGLFATSCQHTNKKKAADAYEKASRYAEQNNFKEALACAQQASRLDPSPRALALKATLLYQTNKLQESKKTFELALKQPALSTELKTSILNNYAAVLVRMGKYSAAQHIWLHLAHNKQYGSPEVAWFNLGLLDWERGRQLQKKKPALAKKMLNNAILFFSKAATLEPDYVDAYFFKAQVLLVLQRKSEAIQCLKKTVALEPAHANAQRMLRQLQKVRP